MGYLSKGFKNKRTGKFVSASRAHQHVGQSLRGYTKAKAKKSGNFYMKKTK